MRGKFLPGAFESRETLLFLMIQLQCKEKPKEWLLQSTHRQSAQKDFLEIIRGPAQENIYSIKPPKHINNLNCEKKHAHVEIPQGCLRALHITPVHTLKVTLPRGHSGSYAVKKIFLVYVNVNAQLCHLHWRGDSISTALSSEHEDLSFYPQHPCKSWLW